MSVNLTRLSRLVLALIASGLATAIPIVLAFGLTASSASVAAEPPLPDARSGEASLTSMEKEARLHAERLRTERRAAAQRLAFHVPFYSIADDLETTLFLMNNISDPITVDLVVRNDH